MHRLLATSLLTLRAAWRLATPVVGVAILVGMFSPDPARSARSVGDAPLPVAVRYDGRDLRVTSAPGVGEGQTRVVFETSSGQELFAVKYLSYPNVEILFAPGHLIKAYVEPGSDVPYQFRSYGPGESTCVKVRPDGTAAVTVGPSVFERRSGERAAHPPGPAKARGAARGELRPEAP